MPACNSRSLLTLPACWQPPAAAVAEFACACVNLLGPDAYTRTPVSPRRKPVTNQPDANLHHSVAHPGNARAAPHLRLRPRPHV
jgi:hypothetical protein